MASNDKARSTTSDSKEREGEDGIHSLLLYALVLSLNVRWNTRSWLSDSELAVPRPVRLTSFVCHQIVESAH